MAMAQRRWHCRRPPLTEAPGRWRLRHPVAGGELLAAEGHWEQDGGGGVERDLPSEEAGQRRGRFRVQGRLRRPGGGGIWGDDAGGFLGDGWSGDGGGREGSTGVGGTGGFGVNAVKIGLAYTVKFESMVTQMEKENARLL
ncbi:hypothetical protein COCNU_scaffold006306G000010 [Cocos nucifera]|nr:hypothetical protein [Cocos nucifera]